MNSDNYNLRAACAISSDCDIIGLAETHLLNDDVLSLDNYRFYGLNRTHIHVNARKGSGGVGFLIKENILQEFDVSVLESSYEGILWLKLIHKYDDFVLLPCVCYLPPENSSRHVDANVFFDNLLTDVYQYQNDGLLYICGDFNSRCGDMDDYIRGIDTVPERSIIDFKSNFYGEMFVEFLINTNMCMLNGRNSINNDFTSVSTKGLSVVDYCFTNHADFSFFKEFSVIRTADLINQAHNIDILAATNIPDHSFLRWQIDTSQFINCNNADTDNVKNSKCFDKFDVSSVPDHFLSDHESLYKLNETISVLEQGFRTQADIDSCYDDFCNILKDNMYKSIPYKTIVNNELCSKKFKPGKAWWNSNLTNIWSDVCSAERIWVKCKDSSEKKNLKTEYIRMRKHFNKEVQKAKRRHWYGLQNNLLQECNNDQTNFWKSFGKIGVGCTKSNKIPMEVKLDDGSISSNLKEVLSKWKNDFSNLFNIDIVAANVNCNPTNNSETEEIGLPFNSCITLLDVKKALDSASRGKAFGCDGIPTEVLMNDASVLFLHSLYNICFNTATIPSIWGKCVINPIPKSSTTDPRDPLSYRGISLASSVYKIYCSILNSRLSSWVESNNKIVDEQNGFRKGRSTTDQISSLTNIIDTRKKQKKSTYCAFIDFRKAYDLINRDKLWDKLMQSGIRGKMFQAIKSIYRNVTANVRINAFNTDWFDIKCGLRQGCILSPILFNLYINDLALFIKSLNVGIQLEDDSICMLMYADDIVLIAENSDDLQILLDGLNNWCGLNNMHVNGNKSNVVHFRPISVPRSTRVFQCGNIVLDIIDRYKYLGVMLHENLDYNITAKTVAQSANRALGLLIARCKLIGGIPYNVFTKLYDSIVWPVINYCAPIWGYKEFSCINAVQTRAMRFFLGVGKYTPNTAVYGEMAWEPPVVRQWGSIANFWSRLSCLDHYRLNKRIALWANLKATSSCKTWFFNVKYKFEELQLQTCYDINYQICKSKFVEEVKQSTMSKFKSIWNTALNRIEGVNGRGRNKLRTYRFFKQNYDVEEYCLTILPANHRSAFTKFRCGVAPIRIETGRYENISVDDRKCPFCKIHVEDECHVILECPIYHDLRLIILQKAVENCEEFLNLEKADKLKHLFTNPSLIRCCAKTCYDILKRRSLLLCK